MITNEIWKPITNFNGYEISNLGRVRRNSRGPSTFIGKILKLQKDKKGYLRVCLCINSIESKKRVHVLVLETFVGPRPNNYDCNHKNGIKDDNRLENLEWVSKSYNTKHAYINGLIHNVGETMNNKLTTDNIITIRKLIKLGLKDNKISEFFPVCRTTINYIRHGKAWKHV